VIRLFLEKYNGTAMAKSSIAENVLEEMGVPKDKTAEVLKLIVEGAESVGFLTGINYKKFVDLLSTKVPEAASDEEVEEAASRLQF
jgi:hypothetical protein